MGKVLVAVDTSEEVIRIASFVGTLLAGTDCTVTLLHAFRILEQFLLETDEEKNQLEADLQAVYQDAIDQMQKCRLNRDLISTETISGVTSRAKAIVDAAQKGGFGTVVVGRRGMSGVEEFVMGRVSNKVMQLAKEMAVWVVN